jgi:hypothetical protein
VLETNKYFRKLGNRNTRLLSDSMDVVVATSKSTVAEEGEEIGESVYAVVTGELWTGSR